MVLFWWIRTLTFRLIKHWGFGLLICMRVDQSGPRYGEFCLYKPPPLWLWICNFHFHLRLKTPSLWLNWNTKSVLAGLPCPKAILYPCCFHIHAKLQWSSIPWNEISFFTAPQIGGPKSWISVGIGLVPNTIIWHYYISKVPKISFIRFLLSNSKTIWVSN